MITDDKITEIFCATDEFSKKFDEEIENMPLLTSDGKTRRRRAGVIHTDFEKGFIRAEVIKYDDYIQYGSEAAVREAGKMGVEGKDYVVQDGDIMHFRFNV